MKPCRNKLKTVSNSPTFAPCAPTTVKESGTYLLLYMRMKAVRTGRRNFLFSVEGTFFLLGGNNLTGILEGINHRRDKLKTALKSFVLILSDPSSLSESCAYSFKFKLINVVGSFMVGGFLNSLEVSCFVGGFLFLVEDFLFLLVGLFNGKTLLRIPEMIPFETV